MNGKFVKSFLVISLLFLTLLPGIPVIGTLSYAQSGRGYTSFNELYDALIENPMDTGARYELARQLYHKKDYKNSLHHLTCLVPVTDDGEITLFYENVKSEYETVLTREINRYLILLESMPVNKATAELIFNNEKEIGEFDHSERVFTEYLRLEPEDRDIRKKLIELYMILGKNEEAYKELSSYVIKYPDDDEANYKLYKLAAMLQKFTRKYEDYFYSNPKDESLIYLAYIEKNRKNNADAIDYLQSYEGEDFLNPDMSNLLYYEQLSYVEKKEEKGNLLEEARNAFLDGECKNASELFDRYFEQFEPDSLILHEAAEANYCAGNYENAAELYEDYFSSYTYNDDDLRKRAHSYQKTKQNFLALDDYLVLEERYPEDEEILVGLARTYNQAGIFYEARRYYQRASEIYPTSFYIIDEKDQLSEFEKRTFGYFPNTFGYALEYQKGMHFSPLFSQYSDSEGYVRLSGGVSTEINLLRILKLGAIIRRVSAENLNGGQNFTEYGSTVKFSPIEFLTLEGYFGSMVFGGNDHHFETEASITYHSELIEADVRYLSGDASRVFNHYQLVFNRIHTELYGGKAYIYFPRGMIVGAEYDLITTEKFRPADLNLLSVIENIGNRMAVVGKIKVFDEYFAGYEYFYADFEQVLGYYYTPQDYIEHKLTFETPFYYFEPFYIKVQGEFGIIPENTLFTKRISFDAKGNLTPDLSIVASGGLKWEYRYLGDYSSRFLNINFRYEIF